MVIKETNKNQIMRLALATKSHSRAGENPARCRSLTLFLSELSPLPSELFFGMDSRPRGNGLEAFEFLFTTVV